MEQNLILGVARTIITPKVGTLLYGYRPDLVSESVNDDLTATAFYFKQGERVALLVSVTLGSVNLKTTNAIFNTHSFPHKTTSH